MPAGANLSVTDVRHATRHPVDFSVIAEHPTNGDLELRVVNISANGFMTQDAPPLDRGYRIIVKLPEVGRIEAYVIWSRDVRTGFQFERVIRADAFFAMIDRLQD